MSRPAKHGDSVIGERARLYDTWRGMRQRCNNSKASYYSIYGGQGIKVCAEWDDYIQFKEWALTHGYTDNLLIERRDNTKDYEPSNCYWADTTVQACNKRKRSGSKSIFIGVAPTRNGWQAYIDYKGKRVGLGMYRIEEEAARVRDDYVKANSLPHKLNF